MKFLHVSITVKDMEESIKFYSNIIGLKLVRRRTISENNAEIAFFKDEQSNVDIELTYWKNKKEWNEGDELDHLAFSVSDLDASIKKFRDLGIEIAKEPFYLKGSTTKIAFIKDPNGIWLELIERK
jgi:lactoylglutathione lyase